MKNEFQLRLHSTLYSLTLTKKHFKNKYEHFDIFVSLCNVKKRAVDKSVKTFYIFCVFNYLRNMTLKIFMK